jgi:hypothetical protein
MCLLWEHGSLSATELMEGSPDIKAYATAATFLRRVEAKGYARSVTEPSRAFGPRDGSPGRPIERFYPTVDYDIAAREVIENFLLTYIRNNPTGLSLLREALDQRTSPERMAKQ